MWLPLIRDVDKDLLNQISGLTGMGWTASVLGYLSTVMGYGNGLVSRLVAEPQSLLYVGGSFFLLTLGLDRLQSRAVGEGSREEGGGE
jgi:hypothetical protein